MYLAVHMLQGEFSNILFVQPFLYIFQWRVFVYLTLLISFSFMVFVDKSGDHFYFITYSVCFQHKGYIICKNFMGVIKGCSSKVMTFTVYFI